MALLNALRKLEQIEEATEKLDKAIEQTSSDIKFFTLIQESGLADYDWETIELGENDE